MVLVAIVSTILCGCSAVAFVSFAVARGCCRWSRRCGCLYCFDCVSVCCNRQFAAKFVESDTVSTFVGLGAKE